jgi:phosphohistidine phosphatase
VRTLLVMRHAKSAWSNPLLADLDRPLTGRGKKDAKQMGREMRARGLAPDLVVTSPAKRARSTAKRVARVLETPISPADALYDGGVEGCLQVIASLPEEAQCVLIIGHNPTFEELIHLLTGRWITLKTATLVALELPINHWAELDANTRCRVRLVLGPGLSTTSGSEEVR